MEQKSKDIADPRADQPQAVERFLEFMEAGDVTEILKCFTDVCREVGLEKEQRTQEDFYSKLKQQLPHYHRSSSLFKILDQRAALKEYNQQSACRGARVLVVGAGPVGLRAAVEVALLGAKVDLVEKRTSFTRNNVLHLWSFLVHDLKSLGIKKFVGQFGTGGIDHISEFTHSNQSYPLLFSLYMYRHLEAAVLSPEGMSTSWSEIPLTSHI